MTFSDEEQAIDAYMELLADVSGALTLSMRTGLDADGAAVGSFVALASVTARYIKIKASVSGANPDVADPTSAHTILTIPQPQSNHNGGWIGFGPNDGYLYIARGDGGGGGDIGAGRRLSGTA